MKTGAKEIIYTRVLLAPLITVAESRRNAHQGVSGERKCGIAYNGVFVQAWKENANTLQQDEP